ncbi:hypothetical protein ACHAW5_002442 [Stephanodiscus triporus]|uniref:Uncharacterized protein n=1 Tax=Stephanodiscus triporus TaxID=2934178 RepID=A0ABD3PN21_9STRA
MVCIKSLLFVAFLTAQHSVEADASHGIRLSKCWSSSPKHIISFRGGSSESVSSWSTGSRYDYRTTSPSPQTRNYQTSSPYTPRQQSKLETKEVFAEAFLRREDRNRFIDQLPYAARVYAILTGQLLFTAGTIHAFHMNPNIRDWMIWNPSGRKGKSVNIPLIGLFISSLAWWITLSSENIRQSSLMRWPLLTAFTIGESIAVGFISSVYAYGSVIKAMVATGAATLSVTLYTLLQKNPQYDLSQWGRALSGFGVVFLLYGLMRVLELFGILPYGFLPYSEAMYCILGAGLFSLYLAHHTRLIVAGKSSKYQMNEKDYILGAMSVYSDIINIFLYILRLLGELEDEDNDRGNRRRRR